MCGRPVNLFSKDHDIAYYQLSDEDVNNDCKTVISGMKVIPKEVLEHCRPTLLGVTILVRNKDIVLCK